MVYRPIIKVRHISEFKMWKYMRDVEGDKAISKVIKLNPVATYDQN